ncbi:MAG TPA: ATP-dependent protease ATPase subunit HslU [Chloroflexota bacterium]|nr:ATP-dependent protease ATPase subunit HslU [Chloroflexota bacterium]
MADMAAADVLTPQRIVEQLDRYVVGQPAAKRALAIALRNRYRRRQLPEEMAGEIMPKNMIMIGPTGVGKTELARRLAKLAGAPFLKTDATKFTEVGYVGRDVDSIIRDLMELAVNMVHEAKTAEVQERAQALAEERIITALLTKRQLPAASPPSDAEARAPSDASDEDAAASNALVPAAASEGQASSMSKREQARIRRRRRAISAALSASRLEEQLIEIETDSDESFPPVFEFMSGMTPEEVTENIQEIMSQVTQSRRRAKQVSVKEARRILTAEEANKLVDWDGVVETATRGVEEDGIVFIDEIDKIARVGHEANVDVSGEGVQRDLLPVVEGSTVMTRYGPVKTDHMLFIAAGAFYNAKPNDLIPELQGRFPLRVELSPLTEADFLRILREPENALTRQYQALLSVEQVTLQFSDDGLEEIAHVAVLANERHENIGARRLNTVMERVLEELSFAAADHAGESIVVDRPYVAARLDDLLKDQDLGKYIL